MALNGRINIDVLFHDTDGTTSLKVVSLEDTTEYTTGKVAIVTGTVGSASQAITTTGYSDAAGQAVSFSAVSRIALQSSGREVRYLVSPSPEVIGLVSEGVVASGSIPAVFAALTNHRVRTTAGTASYTLVLYGT
jgi:hypothetical protein